MTLCASRVLMTKPVRTLSRAVQEVSQSPADELPLQTRRFCSVPMRNLIYSRHVAAAAAAACGAGLYVCFVRAASDVSFGPSAAGRAHLRSRSTAGGSTTEPDASLPRVTRTCSSSGRVSAATLRAQNRTVLVGLCRLPL